MEYARLIRRILAAEVQAQNTVREAKAREARLEEDLAQETQAIRASYQERARKKVEEIRQMEERRTARALEEQDSRAQALGAHIERAYAKYGENWVDTLFHQIVGGQP